MASIFGELRNSCFIAIFSCISGNLEVFTMCGDYEMVEMSTLSPASVSIVLVTLVILPDFLGWGQATISCHHSF